MKKKMVVMLLVTAFTISGCGNQAEIQKVTEETVVETQEETQEETIEVASEESVIPETIETAEEIVEDFVETLEWETQETESEETESVVESQATEESSEAKETVESTEKSEKQQETSQSSDKQKDSGNSNQSTASSAPAPTAHSCTWDGGTVTTNPSCNSEGVKTYKCSCGNTRTESIARTTHNYITESTSATCTEAGKTKTYCSICGEVQSEAVGEAAKGHVPGAKVYWPEAPTCSHGGYYNISCSVCGEHLDSGSDNALPHTEVATEIQHGNCVAATVISIDCGVCGVPIRRESHTEPEEHDWIKDTAEYFNEETLQWEIIEGEYCSRCGRTK